MKKLALNFGSLFLAIGFCLISNNSNSQDVKLTRQEQKEARRAELDLNFKYLDTLIQRKDFVLKADFLENQYGEKVPVSSALNFIRVNSSNAVLQTGSNVRLGNNGVGGVTTQGGIDRWKIVKDFKHLSYTLQFGVTTNIGFYDITMTIGADNNARATISGLTRNKLIYVGHIESVNFANIFKGQDAY
jgi:hypothetical protein